MTPNRSLQGTRRKRLAPGTLDGTLKQSGLKN